MRQLCVVLFSLVAMLVSGSNVQSQKEASQAKSEAQKYFTDVELLNQDGKKMRFYTDLLKGHTVAIIPFFTTCTNVCPPMNATMARVQRELGDPLAQAAELIKIIEGVADDKGND